MPFRDSLLDNFAGDLEFHPWRGAIYLALAAAAFCRFYFATGGAMYTAPSLVFGFGSITLLIKGLFLFRKSSEGIGLTEADRGRLSSKKELPSIPSLFAQIVQDFGAGSLFLGPLVRIARGVEASNNSSAEFHVLIAGAILFGLGWVVRYATQMPRRIE